ncbi:MAG: ParB/RepB/Spo0J family partition protein [Patescibacteria group bacterium]
MLKLTIMPDILNSIFWIEVEKIRPNPFQPRREFNDDRLRDLADSIRQYGVLQPLVVTKKEIEREDGSIYSEYELIAGERRWRASKIAGISQVPCVIRTSEDTDKLKLELAIIENLQREDLNPVDRARAFDRLINEFNLKHVEVGEKVGKSREYVSNTLRMLSLAEDILNAVVTGKITEGHTRPLLMLSDRPEQQRTLFVEIIKRGLTVREAEAIARQVAVERARKRSVINDPETAELERTLSAKLGTRVEIVRSELGGKMTINFLSNADLENILNVLAMPLVESEVTTDQPVLADPTTDDPDLYNIKNFSL